MLRPNKSIAQNTVPRSKNDRPVLILKDTERWLCLQMEVLVGQSLEKIQKGYSEDDYRQYSGDHFESES
jgi:hypothetical protein